MVEKISMEEFHLILKLPLVLLFGLCINYN